LGGHWGTAPQGFANSFITDPDTDHADFGNMMNSAGAASGQQTPLSVLRGQPNAQ